MENPTNDLLIPEQQLDYTINSSEKKLSMTKEKSQLNEPSQSDFPLFQQSDFSFALEDLTLGKIIGDGAFSQVHVASYFGDSVAVKRQRREQKDIQQYVWRELTVLKELNHPRLLEYIGACEDKTSSEIWIITELLPGGDLWKLLASNTPLSWKTRVQIAADAAEGLLFLHSKSVIHRDIKCANILLDYNCRSKLCDFGFARVKASTSSNEKTRRMSICGTDDYMAPEIYFDEEYDECADIYSFGVALIELITRKKVNKEGFLMRTPQNRFSIDMDEFRKAIPSSCPSSLRLLAENCASYEPEGRPSSLELNEWLLDLLQDIEEEDIPTPTFSLKNIVQPPNKTPDQTQLQQGVYKPTTSLQQELEIDRPYKAGYLYKRNRRGLRAWKERWFVLNGFRLAYYGSPEEANGEAPYTHHSVICLHEMDISLKGSHFRFDLFNNNTNTRREFTGHSHADMMDWVLAIHQGISYAEKYGGEEEINNEINDEMNNEMNNSEHTNKDAFDDWLESLGIQHLAKLLRSKGFTSMDYIRQVGDSEIGICEEDLDFLGIDSEHERQVLQQGALALIREEQPQE